MEKKSFVSGLLLQLLITLAVSIAVGAGAKQMGFGYIVPLVAAVFVAIFVAGYKLQKRDTIYYLTIVMLALPSIALQKMLFYTPSEILKVNTLAAVNPTDMDAYWDIDKYYYSSGEDMGALEITSTKYGIEVNTQVYIAVPMYTDSLDQSPSAWLASDYSKADYDATDDLDELLKTEDIVCFEVVPELELANYKEAKGYSALSSEAETMYLRPLYTMPLGRGLWIALSAGTLVIACVGLLLIGKKKEKEYAAQGYEQEQKRESEQENA